VSATKTTFHATGFLPAKSVLNAIALIVTCVWVLSFIAQFIPGLEYKSDPQINLIFGTLVGGAFALPKLLGSKGGDDSPGKHRVKDEGGD
jgi:hypothetical protein